MDTSVVTNITNPTAPIITRTASITNGTEGTIIGMIMITEESVVPLVIEGIFKLSPVFSASDSIYPSPALARLPKGMAGNGINMSLPLAFDFHIRAYRSSHMN